MALHPETTFEDAFMRYIGVNSVGIKQIQAFYIPFFPAGARVLDLGCGDGDFVELLQENGMRGMGVDGDPVMTRHARDRGLPVECQDVFAYLAGLAPDSLDGIFSAHLVEHLPYEKVLELIQLARRALRLGGTIVLATPNVRGLYAHLEGFYLHFGHIRFYHPDLLAFFLSFHGFTDISTGENTRLASPLFAELLARLRALPPPFGPSRNPLRVLRRKIGEVALAPYLRILQQLRDSLQTVIEQLDRAVECYATARK